jgi:TPR repeat protein
MSTLNRKLTQTIGAVGGQLPISSLKPPNPDGTPSGIEFAVSGAHPWASKEGLQRQLGDLQAPKHYSPEYINAYGYRNARDNLGLSYIQSASTPQDVQKAINTYMQDQGLASIEDAVAQKIGELMGTPNAAATGKKRRIGGKYSSAPGVPPNGTGGQGMVDITEPLSQTQMNGPKQTSFQEAAAQMHQSNLNDEYMLRGGTNVQSTNIPPNFMFKDPYSGQMVRSEGYSVPQMNALTNKLEMRHQTDSRGNMYKTVSPYYYNGSNYA